MKKPIKKTAPKKPRTKSLTRQQAFEEVLEIMKETKTTRKDSVNYGVLKGRYEAGTVSDKKINELLRKHGYTVVAEERWAKA